LQKQAVSSGLNLGDLAQKLTVYLESLVSSFESRTGSKENPDSSLSKRMQDVVWANQILHKINQVAGAGFKALGSLGGNLKTVGQHGQEKIRDFCEQEAKERADEILKILGKPSSDTAQRLAGRSVEFSWASDRSLVVDVPQELVTFLSDFRIFTELGLDFPDKVRKSAAEAERYHRFGLKLQQIASFYNGILKEFIPSQGPMLESALSQFGRIVSDQKVYFWITIIY